ncbi:hypothetical protein ES708_11639 [subsurface metagenome]
MSFADASRVPAVIVRSLSTSKVPARVTVPAVFTSKLKNVSAETVPVPSKSTNPFCSLKVPPVLFQLPPTLIWKSLATSTSRIPAVIVRS